MKDSLESKAQIYGIYWKCENLLAMVWKIVNENINKHKDFSFTQFMTHLEVAVKASPFFADKSLRYLPREVYVESIMNVFFNLFYPSKQNIKNWKKTMQ